MRSLAELLKQIERGKITLAKCRAVCPKPPDEMGRAPMCPDCPALRAP